MNYILRTTNLVKKFKDKEVVTNVNMNIKKGEIYGFLGPNGAGKTTIMKMILNLVSRGRFDWVSETVTDQHEGWYVSL